MNWKVGKNRANLMNAYILCYLFKQNVFKKVYIFFVGQYIEKTN